MKLLVDTQMFLWAVQDQDRMPAPVLALLQRPQHEFYLSAASVWEAQLKHNAGNLPLRDDMRRLALDFTGDSCRLLPVTVEQAGYPLPDPPNTKDPFDRLLLAQCALLGMRLVSVDCALIGHRLVATA